MFNAQFRIVGSLSDLSLNSMSRAAAAPKNNILWDDWNVGEFNSLEQALKSITEMYTDGAIVHQKWGIADVYWFRIQTQYFQIRFFQTEESPWRIGLNDD